MEKNKMKIINRTQLNTEAILEVWRMDLEDIEYLIFTQIKSNSHIKWIQISGEYKNGERISSLLDI